MEDLKTPQTENRLSRLPPLDLAPHLNHPLRPQRPRDYLHYIDWLLFFPQAFPWYKTRRLKAGWSLNGIRMIGAVLLAVLPLGLWGISVEGGHIINFIFIVIFLWGFSTIVVRGTVKIRAVAKSKRVRVSLGIFIGLLWVVLPIVTGTSLPFFILVVLLFSVFAIFAVLVKIEGENVGLSLLISLFFMFATILAPSVVGMFLSFILIVVTALVLNQKTDPTMVAMLLVLAAPTPGLIWSVVYYRPEEWISGGIGGAIAYALLVALPIGLGLAFSKKDDWYSDYLAGIGNRSKQILAVSLLWGSFIGASAALSLLLTASFLGDQGLPLPAIHALSGGIFMGVVISAAWFGLRLRPLNWLSQFPLALFPRKTRLRYLPRATPIPCRFLEPVLDERFDSGWAYGIHDITELLTYSRQLIPAVGAVNRALQETPDERLVERIAQLASLPQGERLVFFCSASLTQGSLRYFKPRYAVAAGFAHLHRNALDDATHAFRMAGELPNAAQMAQVASLLGAFPSSRFPKLPEIAALDLAPPSGDLACRAPVWSAVTQLHQAYEDIRVVERSPSRSARNFALNRALGLVAKVRDGIESVPAPERGRVAAIAEGWHGQLIDAAASISEVTLSDPIINPYVVGGWVQGGRLTGREALLGELRALWSANGQLQSVLIFGHRRMGKTSLLRNLSGQFGDAISVAYVTMEEVKTATLGAGEVLMALTDCIADATGVPGPPDQALMDEPAETFLRYLRDVEQALNGKGLVIAIDEFETINQLITAGVIDDDFWGILRGLVQMSSRIAFAFAGLHTFSEMTRDYAHPFFASITPLRVSFLERAAADQVLANPGDEFPLDYATPALDRVYALTHGQPYLLQLIGSLLVQRFNADQFDRGIDRDLVLSKRDVEAIATGEALFRRGRYYFTGVWQQAKQGTPGQCRILTALADHPAGLGDDPLWRASGLARPHYEQALAALQGHDVLIQSEERWVIAVDLFRRWIVDASHGPDADHGS